MSKMKEFIFDIVEMYDEQGMTISEIASYKSISQEEVLEVISQYSMDFGGATEYTA